MASGTDALLHRRHPWIGRAVLDTATGRRGILRAVAPLPNSNSTRPVAWPRPAGGGREWTTSLGALSDPVPITPGTHPARHDVS
ncbi:hypothetical protein [Streptomyces olivaceoviridis]|uniref:hypothetical protein n=1 Tax=Streptomyces olivaceoviridis TaxID=1921 RepID=UPI0036C4E132